MKTSTLIFNVAGVVTLLAIFVGVVDLMKHRSKPRVVMTTRPPFMLTTAPPVMYRTVVPVASVAPVPRVPVMAPMAPMVSRAPMVVADDGLSADLGDTLGDDPLSDLADDGSS